MRTLLKSCLGLALALGITVSLPAEEKEKRTPEDQFKKLDKNSDGKLTLDELKGKKDGDKAAEIEKRFKAMDKDNNGSVSLEEFKAGGKKK